MTHIFLAASMLLVAPALAFASWKLFFCSTHGTDAWAISDREDSEKQQRDLLDAGYVERLMNWATIKLDIGLLLSALAGNLSPTVLSAETKFELAGILQSLKVAPTNITFFFYRHCLTVANYFFNEGSRYLG
jgi:hypothetical protein